MIHLKTGLRAKTSFDRNNALELAKLSKLVYKPERYIRQSLPDHDVTYIEHKDTSTELFIAVNDKDIIIVPRGTQSLKDLGTDINFVYESVYYKLHARELTYHKGFYESFKSVEEKIMEVVYANRGKNIYTAGHSLGGAIATIIAVNLYCIKGMAIKASYTFGSPRVFDESSARFVNGMMKFQIHRVVNNNDIVTHVPPEIAGFSHVGNLDYFEENGKLHVNENLSWWTMMRFSLAGRINDVGKPGTDGFKDHFVESYIDYLRT